MHRWPNDPAIDDDRRHHTELESHPVATLWRQFALGAKIADAVEDEDIALNADEAHATEADPRSASDLVAEDDLIGRQRDAPAVSKVDEGSGWAVADDGQGGRMRHVFGVALEVGAWNELDEQRDAGPHAGRT